MFFNDAGIDLIKWVCFVGKQSDIFLGDMAEESFVMQQAPAYWNLAKTH